MNDRFSELFNEFLKLEYGVCGEDFSIKVVGTTLHHYYLELYASDGTEQIVYDRDERTWQFIS